MLDGVRDWWNGVNGRILTEQKRAVVEGVVAEGDEQLDSKLYPEPPERNLWQAGYYVGLPEFFRGMDSVMNHPGQLPGPDQLLLEAGPMLMMMVREIERNETSGNQRHFVRSSTVTEMVSALRFGYGRRNWLKQIMVFDHTREADLLVLDDYQRQLAMWLRSGPDVDVKAEVNLDHFDEEMEIEMRNHYQWYHHTGRAVGVGQLGESPLHLRVNMQNGGEKVRVWETGSAIKVFTTAADGPMDQMVFVVERSGKRPNGVPYVDMEVAVPRLNVIRFGEKNVDQLEPLFNMGVSPWETLTPEQRERDLRVGDFSNSWDRKGRVKFGKREQLGNLPSLEEASDQLYVSRTSRVPERLVTLYDQVVLVMLPDTLEALTRPIEYGEKASDLREDLFMLESLRVLRKALVYEHNLDLSDEGMAHLDRTAGEYGYGLAVADETVEMMKSRLGDENYREGLRERMERMDEKTKTEFQVQVAGEVMAMLFYQPRKAMGVLRDFGLVDYFPGMRQLIDRWEQLIQELPDQLRYERSLMMRLAPPEVTWEEATDLKHIMADSWMEVAIKQHISIFNQIESALAKIGGLGRVRRSRFSSGFVTVASLCRMGL